MTMTSTIHIDVKQDINGPKGSGVDWKFSLLGGLATPAARRIYTAADFHAFTQTFRPSSPNTSRALSEMFVKAGALRRVSGGIFLNRRATPPAEMTEVAKYLRAGAVVSLHSVLGRCGFLNNIPDEVVMAVVPTSATKRPSLGEVTTSSGNRFWFFGLAEKFFPSTPQERWEMLAPGAQCETFRPEAALLHWIHLADMQRSSLTLPPVDVDMSALNEELLGSLANRWGLTQALASWKQKAESLNFGEEPEQVAVSPVSPEIPAPVVQVSGVDKSHAGAPVSDAADAEAQATSRVASQVASQVRSASARERMMSLRRG